MYLESINLDLESPARHYANFFHVIFQIFLHSFRNFGAHLKTKSNFTLGFSLLLLFLKKRLIKFVFYYLWFSVFYFIPSIRMKAIKYVCAEGNFLFYFFKKNLLALPFLILYFLFFPNKIWNCIPSKLFLHKGR